MATVQQYATLLQAAMEWEQLHNVASSHSPQSINSLKIAQAALIDAIRDMRRSLGDKTAPVFQ